LSKERVRERCNAERFQCLTLSSVAGAERCPAPRLSRRSPSGSADLSSDEERLEE